MHMAAGRVVIEAELGTGAAARRLRDGITEVFGHPAEFLVLAGQGPRGGSRYLVRVSAGRAGEALARQAGMVDTCGIPVRGLPRQVVSGAACDCEAAWRGAFLAHGSVIAPGGSMALEVTCPGPEAALALAGAARRMKVHAQTREVRGVHRVVVKGGEAITAMLARLGAHEAVLACEDRRMSRAALAVAGGLTGAGDARKNANLGDANLCRSERAAEAAAARAERALQILGSDAPAHLAAAGKLRLAHRHLNLEALGQLADPPLTKHAIAGRIRRLVDLAGRRPAGTPGGAPPEPLASTHMED
jgi:DNA-binding protein WhiA